MPDTLQMKQNKIYTQYKLYAYVEHFGNLRQGHYTATIKSQDDSRWYIFNDLKVELSSYDHFQLDPTQTSRSVYLLFYQKQKDTNVDRRNTPDTLPTTTLLKGTGNHHSSSKEEAVNIKFYTHNQPVTPRSKRKEERPRNDEENEPKRIKTNIKHDLGPEERSERSQVFEDKHKETGQNFDPGKQSNVNGSYRNPRDVNEKPRMQNKHNEREDQAMAKMQQPEYLLEECSPQKAEWDTHVSQQDSGHQNSDSMRQSKHKGPNVKASYRDFSNVHEMAKIHDKHNEGEEQAMADMQLFRQQNEYSPQKAGWGTQHVRGLVEYRQQDGMGYKDRDGHTRVNRSNSYAPSKHERQCELIKRQQSKQMENSSDDYNQSNNTWNKQNVGQQIGPAQYRQDVKSFKNNPKHYRLRRTKSCAPSETRSLENMWPNPENSRGRRERSLVRNEPDQKSTRSFHEPHNQHYSQENFRKEIQNDKMRNDGLRKNSRRDGQNERPSQEVPEQINPQQCLPRLHTRQQKMPEQINPQQCLQDCIHVSQDKICSQVIRKDQKIHVLMIWVK
ncbi:hypothetical protein NL108_003845 [Boleophthalmus pectinirostris]|nr:hypothetical protein NL108_003845 [Boleophthalmus pectinirostris]